MTLIAPGAQAYIDGIIAKLAYTVQARERLTTHVPAFWAMQAIQSANVAVIALRTMLDAIQLELGNLDEDVESQPEGDYHAREDTRLQALRTMQSLTATQLQQVSTGNSAVPAFALMTATVPIPSPVGGPDANSTYYTGNPNPTVWWMAAT